MTAQSATHPKTTSKITVEDVSSVVKRLKVEVPPDIVGKELDNAFTAAARTIRLNGFRPGKVPRKVVEERVGERVRGEVVERVIQRAFREAVETQNLDTVTNGVVEEHTLEPGGPLLFTARVEVRPRVDVTNYKGLEVTREPATVTTEEVDAEVARLRDEHAQIIPIEGREDARKGDLATVEVHAAFDDGTPLSLGETNETTFEVGAGAIAPEIDDALVGLRPSEHRDVDVVFAADHAEEGLRGRRATFHLTLKDIKGKEVPEADDDFARDVGHESLLAMRGTLRDKLVQQKQKAADEKVRSDLLKTVLEAHPFEVPPGMVERHAGAMASDFKNRLMRAGLDENGAQAEVEKLWTHIWNDAIFFVRRSVILDAVARAESITASDADIDEKLAEIGKAAGQPLERMRARYADPDRRAALTSQLRDEKTLDLLVREAKIKDVLPAA